MRHTLIRWALCAFVSLNLVMSAPVARSETVADAFQSLISGTNTSVNSPGAYRTQARNVFVAGGLDVRFPNKAAPTLFSVTPFHFNAGCGGISAFFGGFSFISGKEIEQLIRSVAQNAIGMAVELVITTLCGPCASVMQVMRGLAVMASKTSLDSCHIASQLVDNSGLKSLLGSDDMQSLKVGSQCSLTAAMQGQAPDQSGADNSLCNDIQSGVANLTKAFGSALTAAGIDPKSTLGKQKLCEKGAGSCNTIWTLLAQTDLGSGDPSQNVMDRLLMMNVLGTTVTLTSAAPPTVGAAPASGTAATTDSSSTSTPSGSTALPVSAANASPQPDGQSVSYAPKLGNVTGSTGETADMEVVFRLLMCGPNANPTVANPAGQATVQWACSGPANANGGQDNLASASVWDCSSSNVLGTGGSTGGGPLDPQYVDCLNVVQTTLGATMLGDPAQNPGYLVQVSNTLWSGVQAVQTNSPMPQAVINLIQSVPVPIYQAINAAAVYPDAGADLIGVMSYQVAELLVFAHLRDIIRSASKFEQPVGFSQKEVTRVLALMGGMKAATNDKKKDLASQIVLQQQLLEQIRILNVAMQREIMTPELLGAQRYGTALTTSASK